MVNGRNDVTKTHVLAIVGPTGTGKSALAMAVAKRLPIEIVCMDSMQVYRGMDIGTAKPTQWEQREVPHHMLNLLKPTETFSASQYTDQAVPILHEIKARGKLPILVGGTGLYLSALRQGFPLGGAIGSEVIRNKLSAICDEPEGKAHLHAMLARVDELTAKKLHVNDTRRMIRALEVYEVTGKPISQQNAETQDLGFSFLPMGITMDRDELYQRINWRVDHMMLRGFLGEVKSLLEDGVTPQDQPMKGIGYKELVKVLQAGLPETEAVALIKRNTRRYAKRQWTWFKKERDIEWFDISRPNGMETAMGRVERFWEMLVRD